MKKIFLLLILGIFLISLASATSYNLTSGESTIISLEKEFKYYTIIGNTTEIEINVTQLENNNILIIVGKYVQNDNFEIIFFDSEKEIITEHHYSGGTNTIYKNNTINNTIYIDKIIKIEKELNDTEIIDDVLIKKQPNYFKFTLYFLAVLGIIGVVVCIIVMVKIAITDYVNEEMTTKPNKKKIKAKNN